MIVDGAYIPAAMAARYGATVAMVVKAHYRTNGLPVPGELGEWLYDLERVGRRFRAEHDVTALCGSAGSGGDGSAGSVRGDMVTADVAAVLGISRRGVRWLAERERLPGRRTPSGWRFDPLDVAEYQEARR